MIRAIAAVAVRELRLAARRRSEFIQPPTFYVLVVMLFGLATEPGSPLVRAFVPTILWLAMLLAALLGAERLFRDDLEDGTLEQLCLSPYPLSSLVLAKLAAQWLVLGLPLVVLGPAVAAILGLPGAAVSVLAIGLALGSVTLVFLCGLGSALTAALPRAGVLLPLIVLPLAVPVLVFGSGAVRGALAGLPTGGPLYFLAALTVLSLTLLPVAIAAAVRNTIE